MAKGAIAWLRFLHWICLLAALLPSTLYAGRPVLAQQALLPWQSTTLINLLGLNARSQCFSGSKSIDRIHILGITSAELQLEKPIQIAILNDLSKLVNSQMGATITKADSFQFIATSDVSFSEQKVDELQALTQSASDADITILLRPYRQSGGSVDTEIILWARGSGEDGKRTINCTPSFSVSIPTETADPRCTQAYEAAIGAGTRELIQGFVAFFPDCSQVEKAKQRLAELLAAEKSVACERNLAIAQAQNTSAALTEYLDGNDCPGQNSVVALRDRLLNNERCDRNFADAKKAATVDSFERFIMQNRDCSLQVENAQIQVELINTRKTQFNVPPSQVQPVAEQSTIPQLQAPRNVSPSFDCDRAGTASEFAICQDANLASLDHEASQRYSQARGRLSRSSRQQLLSEQRNWLSNRDRCGADVRCLQQSYSDRILELIRWGG